MKTKSYFAAFRGQLLVVLFILVLLPNWLSAQIRHSGSPIGPSLKKRAIPQYLAPDFDPQQAWQQALQLVKHRKKEPAAKILPVQFSPQNSGLWTDLPEGRLWQLGLQSTGAAALGLQFGSFVLTEGCRVFVYDPQSKNYLGAYLASNNRVDAPLPIQSLPSDQLVVELFVPHGADEPQLLIDELHHYFGQTVLKKGQAEACNININCDLGADWQATKRAVLRYTFSENGFKYFCSGALVNNTAQDQRPYFLSANHCIDNQAEAESAIFYFNYESASCQGNEGDASQTISGATFRATGPLARLDFSLLELSSAPPEAYKAIYAGWNRGALPDGGTVSIHHPAGDIKKISRDAQAPITLQQPPSGWPDDPASHWAVVWDQGSTAGGSSGAPLFDSQQRIVGDLSGGEASCLNATGQDYFTKFDQAWNKYPGQTSSLAPWLDPLGTNPMQLDAFDTNRLESDLAINEIIHPKGPVHAHTPLVPVVSLINRGTSSVTDPSVEWLIDDQQFAVSTVVTTLAPGEWVLIQKYPMESIPTGRLQVRIFGKPDNYPANDTLSVALVPMEGTQVELRFEQANQSNIHWQLSTIGGPAIYRRGAESVQMVDSYPFVLADGCYSLTIDPKTWVEGAGVSLHKPTTNEDIAKGIFEQASIDRVWPNNELQFCIQSKPIPYRTLNSISRQGPIIEFSGAETYHIDLLDLQGSVRRTWPSVQARFSPNVEGMQAGRYLLRIRNQHGQYTQPFILLGQ